MTIKKNLLALALAVSSLQAGAVVVTTAPVLVNDPGPGVDRQVWCIAQNLTKSDKQVVSSSIFGYDGQVIQEITKVVQPGVATWLSGATGGSGLVYCQFNVPNKTKVRTYLSIQDVPNGQTANTQTILTLEAR